MSDEETGNGHRIIGPRGLKRNITRQEAGEYIAAASLQVGQKIYDEISKEHARVFAEMEQRLNAQIAELRAKVAELINGPGAVHGILPLSDQPTV